MELERITEEYLRELGHLKTLEKITSEYKKLLIKAIDEQGVPDDKGHKWLAAGKFMLQRQKRQGDKLINKERAEGWAKAKGMWESVKVVREELDEDALLAYMYEHRDDEELEDEFNELYDTPPVTWAFMTPIEGVHEY